MAKHRGVSSGDPSSLRRDFVQCSVENTPRGGPYLLHELKPASTIVSTAAKALIAVTVLAASAPAISVERRPAWRWHEAEVELYDPSFSPDGKEVALVRRRHIPDGHEAESIPETTFKKLAKAIKENPRYADPEVVVVSFGARVVKPVDWGLTPVFSPNGAMIAYAHQTSPASGKRMLAQTLAGNEIRIFVRSTRKVRSVAQPTSGYLASPAFTEDGTRVVYAISDAVNGAFGGGVGVGQVGVSGGPSETLYPPTKANDLYELIGDPRCLGNRVLALRKVPTGSGKYMASAYRTELVNVAAGEANEVIYSWGVRKLGDRSPADYAIANSRILVFDGGWREPGAEPSGAASERTEDAGVVSPNGKLVATRGERKLTISELQTGNAVGTWDLGGEPGQVSWAQDSRRLVAIITKYRDSDNDLFAYDELVGLQLP